MTSSAAVAGEPEVVSAVVSTAGRSRRTVWPFVLGSALLAWTITLFVTVYDRYSDFRYARFDLGNMVQAVSNTADGRILENTNVAGEQVSRLASHVDPILVVFAPLWMVWSSPAALAFVQIVAVGVGAVPVFWLTRRHSGSARTGALVGLAYLAYPWIGWAGVDAFHPVALSIPLFLFAIWFLDSDRLLPFAVCAALAALTGELMGALVAALGIWYALGRGRTKPGAVIAASGAAWTLFSVYVVVPAFAGKPSAYYGIFEHVGGSPLGVLRTAVTSPQKILATVTGSEDLLYAFLLGAPVAGAFLLAPGLAAVALPQVAVNLLAIPGGNTDPHEHYVNAILPFLFAAIAMGVGRLRAPRRDQAAGLVLGLSLAATAAVGPWPATVLGASRWDPLGIPNDEHIRALEGAIERVPDDAPVSATNRLGSRLSGRRYFYSVPVLGRAEWVVLESADTWIPRDVGGYGDPALLEAFHRRMERSRAWEKVFEQDGVLVFRKVRP